MMASPGNIARSWLSRAEPLICTGMPGAYRIASFFAIQHTYSISELGRVASNMAVAQMAGFFTAIGWATLILVRISSAQTRKAANEQFFQILWMSLLTTAFISACLLTARKLVTIPFEPLETIGLLWGWTLYQIARHYFVAQKWYRGAICFDVVLTLASCGAAFLARDGALTPSGILAIAMASVGILMLPWIGFPDKIVSLGSFEKKGLEFGLANLVSGGMTLVLTPLASTLCGSNFAGVFSLVSSASAIGALVPRAISLTQIPVLSKLRAKNESFDAAISVMRRQIYQANYLILLFNICISVGLVLYKVEPGRARVILLAAALLLALVSLISSSSVTHANVLMVFERSGIGLKISAITTAIFAVICVSASWMNGWAAFLMILISACLVSQLKNALLAHAAARELARG
jgi:O-antigen/teichoic acid export membrane protein